MRKLIFSALRFLKWQVLIPAFWYLGLPRSWLVERFRLVPLLPNTERSAASAHPAEKVQGNIVGIETRYPAPARTSIYAAPTVAATIKVLAHCEGHKVAQRYVKALAEAAPEHLPDLLWGEILALKNRNPKEALDEALKFQKSYPLDRFNKHIMQILNQAGNIRLARGLAERISKADASVERTLSVLQARERLLEHGFSLPTRSRKAGFRPSPRRAFYLLHNSLPYNSGGYATRTHGLVRSIQTHGWDVECVTRLGFPSDVNATREWVPPVDHIDGVPYRRLKDRSGAYRKVDPEYYMKINAEAVLGLARKRRPSVIHAASNHINGIAAAYVGRILSIPSIYEVRGFWELTRMSRQPEFEGSELYEMIVRLETQACLEVDHVVAITGALKQLLIDRGVPESKIRVIPNGVDVDRFATPLTDSSSIRARWQIPVDAMVLGYVGSMPQYEGLIDLLDAMTHIDSELVPLVHCLIVGDGDEFRNLKKFAEEHGLGDRVHFAGRVSHDRVEQYYAAIDVVVFPRRPQPVTEVVSPMKPFEAMAMGKPVLASDVAALAEIISDGRTGVLFDKGSVASLTEHIEGLAGDPDYRLRLGAEGQRWVRENRDWKLLSLDLVADYERLVASNLELMKVGQKA